ncbi:MAG: hypothetical protein PUG74_11960 [Prevotellaceae bacterium]|nr:hypothetical protein [Prevotellaceae bacterium]
MERTKRRKAELVERTKKESFQFQVEWGIQSHGLELTDDVRKRIDDELRILLNLGLAGNFLTLKEIVDGVQRDLNAMPEPFKGNLAGSLVAYCLGISTGNPLERNLLKPIEEHCLPLQLTLYYDNEIRNEVVDWVKAHGYREVKTRLGQPILKMNKMVVEFKRVVK